MFIAKVIGAFSLVTKDNADHYFRVINKKSGTNPFYVSFVADITLNEEPNEMVYDIYAEKLSGGTMLCKVPLYHQRKGTPSRELILGNPSLIFSGVFSEFENILLFMPEDKGKQRVKIWLLDDKGMLESRYKITIQNSSLPSF